MCVCIQVFQLHITHTHTHIHSDVSHTPLYGISEGRIRSGPKTSCTSPSRIQLHVAALSLARRRNETQKKKVSRETRPRSDVPQRRVRSTNFSARRLNPRDLLQELKWKHEANPQKNSALVSARGYQNTARDNLQ